MIRFINKFIMPTEEECLPANTFVCVDTETNMLVNSNIMKPKCYYICHNGKETDRYKRAVMLDFVEICETDQEDNLSNFGFHYIEQLIDGYKKWSR